MRKAQMHLAQFSVSRARPTTASRCGGIPGTAAAGYDWGAARSSTSTSRASASAGRFDMVFFADLNYISDAFTGSLAPALRNATQAPEHDPIPLLSFMAAVTTNIGLGATYSVSHQHPFHAARLWATLDHLTKGRAGVERGDPRSTTTRPANYGEDYKPTDGPLRPGRTSS